MVVSKVVEVVWNAKTKRHYMERGYTYTKMGDSFTVDVNDLTTGSNVLVKLKCDYCGKEYEVQWYSYQIIKQRELIHKDACADCCEVKARESVVEKYGGHSEKYYATNEKRVKTNIERFGCTNPFANKGVKDKIIKTNNERYGVSHNQQCKEIRNKTMNTCKKRYGVNHYIELFKGKFIGANSPCWKDDVVYQRAERATHEYIQWRKSVFDRDLYTCQKCKSKSGSGKPVELNAHHIYNWKDNPELRYDLENGITLCEHCHNAFHSKYGKRNNNKEQLLEFINN